MEKTKLKGTPLRRRQNLIFLAAGILLGVIGTSLASTLFVGEPAIPTPQILYPIPSPTLPLIPTMPPTHPAQMAIPQATVIAPRVTTARISPDGSYMVVGSWDYGQGVLNRYDFSVQANLSGGVSTLVANIGMVDDMVFSATGDKLAVMAQDGVRLYDMEPEPKERYRFQGYFRAAFSPDGKWLVVGGGNDGLRVMEADALNFVDSVPINGYVHALAISPDSQQLAVAVADSSGTTRIRLLKMDDLHSSSYTEYLAGSYVFQMVFHPDGSVLAVAADATVRVFDLSDGSQRFFALDALARIRSIAFNPDGTWLAVGGGDTGAGVMGAIYTWRWDESAILRPDESWRDYHMLTGHVHDVNSVAFTPDGQFLLSASSDGSVRLWDYLNTGGEVSRLQI